MDMNEERPEGRDRSTQPTLAGRAHWRRRHRRIALAVAAAAAIGVVLLGAVAANAATVPLPDLSAAESATAATTAPAEEKPAEDDHGHGSTPTSAPSTAAPSTETPTTSPDATAETIHVDIEGFAFSPASLTINMSDTVVWHNHDTAPHNVVVTAGPETFESPTLQQGDTFTYTFMLPGTYSYYCAFHPNMTGTVTVQGDGTPPPPSGTTCIPEDVAGAIMAHIKAAHLETSPDQQVKDALNVDDYVLMRTVWLEQVLTPIVDGGPPAVEQMIAAIMAHIEAAHLETSPGQQIMDALNADDYLQMHTIWLEQVLAPAVEQLTC